MLPFARIVETSLSVPVLTRQLSVMGGGNYTPPPSVTLGLSIPICKMGA